MLKVHSLPDPEATDVVGHALWHALEGELSTIQNTGAHIELDGNLGAGKTALTRALLREAGWSGPVQSPTFALMNTYPLPSLTVNHFDFYRFEDPDEFEAAGFREAFGPGQVNLTEWTERAQPHANHPDLILHLDVDGLGRRLRGEPVTPLGHRLFESLCSKIDALYLSKP